MKNVQQADLVIKRRRLGLPKSNSNPDYRLLRQLYHTDTKDCYIPITLPRCLRYASNAGLWYASATNVFVLNSNATPAIVF